ncbi:PaaI family thioesterase [Ralstonia pseudosolanacearum]|uniref:PaaI family thioesterase n=1 Tax=Ralstonia pseudosolanacearum TaxID=1310165 RepID=UPI002E20E81D
MSQGIPLQQHYNPLGTVHGGWFATLLDPALGCAVQTSLPAGRSYTTAELSMNIVRPASHKTGPAASRRYGRSLGSPDGDSGGSCRRRQRQALRTCHDHMLHLRCTRRLTADATEPPQ